TRLEYDITDALTVYGAIGYRDGSNDQIFPQSTTAVNAVGNFTVRSTYYDSYTKTTSGNAGLRWNFKTAGIGHVLSAGVTGMKQEAGNVFITGNSAPSNIYNPVPLPSIPAARTPALKASD